MQFLQIQDSEPFSIKSLDERLKLINFYLMLEPTLCPAPLVRLDYPSPTAPHRRGPPQPLQAPHRRSPALPMQVRQWYLVPQTFLAGTALSSRPYPFQQFQRVTILAAVCTDQICPILLAGGYNSRGMQHRGREGELGNTRPR